MNDMKCRSCGWVLRRVVRWRGGVPRFIGVRCDNHACGWAILVPCWVVAEA